MALFTHHHVLFDSDSEAAAAEDVTGETITLVPLDETTAPEGVMVASLGVGAGGVNHNVRLFAELPGGMILTQEELEITDASSVQVPISAANNHLFSGLTWKLVVTGDTKPPVAAKVVLYTNVAFKVIREAAS